MDRQTGSLLLGGGDVVSDGRVRRTDVRIVDGRISEIGDLRASAGETSIDCSGLLVCPGYIDLQCNGAGGRDLTADPTSIGHVAAELPQFGVTAFLPTVVTSPAETRAKAIAAQVAYDATVGARPLGLHFEGPLLSADRAGAHDRRFLALPPTEEVRSWIESGAVRMVTLAPEVTGAVELAETLSEAGVLVAAGHTAMTPQDLSRATEGGVRYATHLFNAMTPLHHRAPGAVGAVLANEVVVAGLICDGLHVDPTAVRIVRRALGPDRISLVSDASPALGTPFGTLGSGRRQLVHDESGVRLTDGTLAGGAVGLDAAVRNYRRITGCSIPEVVSSVTEVPARLLGLATRGRIAPGAEGDLTIVDPELRVALTVVGGRIAWRS